MAGNSYVCRVSLIRCRMGRNSLLFVPPLLLRSVHLGKASGFYSRACIFRIGFLKKGAASVYSAHCLAPVVGRRLALPCRVSSARPTRRSLRRYFVGVTSLCARRAFKCRVTLGSILLRTLFLLLRCDAARSTAVSTSSSGLGGMLSCVSLRCTGPLAVSRLTRLYCFDRCRFVHFFGGRVGVAYVRCVGGIQLRGTMRLFRRKRASVLRISLSINFRGLSCFRETFGTGCRVAPLSFVGELG